MLVTDLEWLQNGNQQGQRPSRKDILLLALRKPMTATDLIVALRKAFPKAQLRDVWRMVRSLDEQKLVYCLAPKEMNGRLYFLTDKGRSLVRKRMQVSVPQLPRSVNWRKYSIVARGKARKSVLLAMKLPWQGRLAKTTGEIRKLSLQIHPLCMGATIRALGELEELRLIKRIGLSAKKSLPLYGLSAPGMRILKQMEA
jgi:hypothetical protein